MARIVTTVSGRISYIGDLNTYQGRNGGRDVTVVRFGVIESASWRNENGSYDNGETLSYECTAFGRTAENIASALSKGVPVTFTAIRKDKAPFTRRNGETVPPGFEYEIISGGPDLSQAVVVTAEKASAGGYQGGGTQGGAPRTRQAPASNAKPARQSAPARDTAPVQEDNLDGFDDDDEPPF